MDGDAEPTDTPFPANSTNIISCFVVVRESVLLAAQGVSVGWWKARTSSRALGRTNKATALPRFPFPLPLFLWGGLTDSRIEPPSGSIPTI